MTATLLGLSPEEWTAIAAWSAVGAALVGGGIALGQLKESQRLRREQAQPYVVVYMAEDPARYWLQFLVIKNLGSTAAHDVRVRIEPPLISEALDGKRLLVPAAIPVLVPGQEWRTFWDTTIARHEKDQLPKQHDATVSFDDSKRRHTELRYILDWGPLQQRGHIDTYGMHHAADALRDISKTMKEWTEGRRGIRANVRDGDARDDNARKNRRRRMRLETLHENGHQWLSRLASVPLLGELVVHASRRWPKQSP